MSNSFRLQRIKLLERLRAVEELLGNSEVLSDQKQYRELAREHAYLLKIAEASLRLDAVEKQLADNRECLVSEKDPEFVLVLREDSAALQIELERLSHQLEMLLIPPDPHDSCNTLLEIRAGTGGEEAALFVADVVRMYKMYADRQGWRWEQLSFSPSETGGFKEYVMVISGDNVYRFLRYEGGGHRVQRVPETESQGRIHTSAITVAVLLEPDEDDEIAIREEELRIDTFRSSGAGGQHVNTTDSAVRITHLPTGVVVAVQDERSQHKNKAKALRILQARLYEFKCKEEEAKRSSERMQQMGSGDRSDRIRTYNFPQNRVTDHRNNMTVYALEEILSGGLDKLTEPLVAYYKQQRFAGDEDVSSASA